MQTSIIESVLLIAGAQAAIYQQDGVLHAFRLDTNGKLVDCQRSAGLFLSSMSERRLIRNVHGLQQIQRELQIWNRQQRTLLDLISAMDTEYSDEARKKSIALAEKRLENESSAKFAHARMLGCPLPFDADLAGAQKLAQAFHRCAVLFNELALAKDTISPVLQIVKKLAADFSDKSYPADEICLALVDQGVVSAAALAMARKNPRAVNHIKLIFFQNKELLDGFSNKESLMKLLVSRISLKTHFFIASSRFALEKMEQERRNKPQFEYISSTIVESDQFTVAIRNFSSREKKQNVFIVRDIPSREKKQNAVVKRNFPSRWVSGNNNFASILNQDLKARAYLMEKLKNASVARIVIERPFMHVRFTVYSSCPGIVTGKKGEYLEVLKSDLTKIMEQPVHVNIEEVRKPEIVAQLVADSISRQVGRRITFRRAVRRAIKNAMSSGALGIKIVLSAPLKSVDISQKVWFREGSVPLHTLRHDISYGTCDAKTSYGIFHLKVWIFNRDDLANDKVTVTKTVPAEDYKRRVLLREGGKPNAQPSANREGQAKVPKTQPLRRRSQARS